MATVDEVYVVVTNIQKQVGKIEEHLEKLNGKVGGLDVRVAVVEEWKRCVGEPSAKDTSDLKIELAKVLAMGGGAGGVFWLLNSGFKAVLGGG